MTSNLAASTPSRLGRCAFGDTSAADTISHPGLRPLNEVPTYEIWHGHGDTLGGHDDAVAWRADACFLFGHITMSLGTDEAQTTELLYRQIFACIKNRNYPHLLRIWNFLPRINEGAGDAERYKQFCTGRALAFDDCDLVRHQYPAATAIGTRTGEHLNVYFLAARTPGRRIENPRQTDAPQYPRQYGPRSPRFARATAWPADNPRVLLVSGTASIVGHQSRHIGNPNDQLEEIWHNLEALQQQTEAHRLSALRVYLRRQSDYATARGFLAAHLPSDVPVLYLHADICRTELLLEMEAVYRR